MAKTPLPVNCEVAIISLFTNIGMNKNDKVENRNNVKIKRKIKRFLLLISIFFKPIHCKNGTCFRAVNSHHMIGMIENNATCKSALTSEFIAFILPPYTLLDQYISQTLSQSTLKRCYDNYHRDEQSHKRFHDSCASLLLANGMDRQPC